MSEILQWVLIVIAVSFPAIIVALINYFAHKKKIAAETKGLELKNKITKDITYDQLKGESKHKDIKNKIEIFQRLAKIEGEIKSKEGINASNQKKLESLKMIKKEFEETLVEKAEQKLKLGAEPEKNEKAKKEDNKSIKKSKSTKTNRKSKERQK